MPWRLWLCTYDAVRVSITVRHLTPEKVDAIIEECRKNSETMN
jgi:hypothetical protein